jgi:hypothetical protein
MKNKIKAICLSKINILSVSFSIFLFLKDIKEVITGFASHLILIGLSTIVLIGLLFINLFLTRSKEKNIESNSSSYDEKINQKENIFQPNTSLKSSKTIFAKIIFATILFFSLMTIGSLYYVKNMGVYYVVLENNLTEKEAIDLMESTNNSSDFSSNGLSSRILELPNDKYELILRSGYISETKADSDLEKVKSLKLEFKPYKVGPQKVANYFKKIKYLQNDIFN